jgi:hypothetical protein
MSGVYVQRKQNSNHWGVSKTQRSIEASIASEIANYGITLDVFVRIERPAEQAPGTRHRRSYRAQA